MINKLYKHQGNIYKVIRNIALHNFSSQEQVKEFRDYINSNHVLKTKTHYMFCEVVEDAEIVE